jgi:hypothetical protein
MEHVDLSGVDRYIGGDVVPELIHGLRRVHGRTGRDFLVLDALSSELPTADAVLIRDLLGHLTHAQVHRLLRNVKRSDARLLLATHYPNLRANNDVAMGAWRPQNFTLPPYSWPEPIALLHEEPPALGEREDKTLAAWHLSGI